MKLGRVFLLAAIAVALPMAALGQQQVVFGNSDGTFTYDDAGQTLSLGMTSSGGEAGVLTSITGLGAFGIPDAAVTLTSGGASPTCASGGSSTACLGSITFSTATAIAGTNTITSTSGSAHFGMGGNFMISYADGVSFSGSFSHAKWINIGPSSWVFTGFIMNGTLTIPMAGGGFETFTNINAGTVQLTDTDHPGSNHPNKGTITFQDSAGSTNFSVAPEPGTLTLFGSGLVALGVFARRRLTARPTTSND